MREVQEVVDIADPSQKDECRDMAEFEPSTRFSFSNFSFKVNLSILFHFPCSFQLCMYDVCDVFWVGSLNLIRTCGQ